jgi:hypothetical protein
MSVATAYTTSGRKNPGADGLVLSRRSNAAQPRNVAASRISAAAIEICRAATKPSSR